MIEDIRNFFEILVGRPKPRGLDAIRPVTIRDGKLLCDALRLRHDVFCDELKWVNPTGPCQELDIFDECSTNLGLVEGEELRAYLRLTRGPGPFMIDVFFPHLLESPLPRSPRVAELSRLCVDGSFRKERIPTRIGALPLSMFLYREAFRWSRSVGVDVLCFVTTSRIARLLSMQGLTIESIASCGVGIDNQVLSTLDWNRFLDLGKPCLVDWFSEAPGSRAARRPRPLALGS